MGKVTYRAPKRSDLDGLLSFVNGLVDEDTFIQMDKRFTKKEERKWLDEKLKLIRKRDAVMILAESGNRLVGNCIISRRTRSRKVRHFATLGISVRKGFRGRGIGEALARRAMALAKKRMGTTLLTLTCFANNRVARNLYRKLGFRKCGRYPGAFYFKGRYVDEIMMYKRLDGG